MSGAAGIDTRRIDRLSFGLGCGLAGIAGAAFTTIGSTGPTSGSLYIVDTFLTVVFGGAESLIGTIASAFSIAQAQATTEFFMTGSMAKVLTLMASIFIPLTFVAGVYGMNFENMPEVSWPYSYTVVIGVTVLFTAGAFLYFKKKRWF